MKKIIFLSFLLFLALLSANNIQLLDNSTSRLEIKLTLPEIQTRQKKLNDGNTYHSIIQTESSSLPVGFPDIPALAYWIMLPNENLPQISINQGNELMLENIEIAPVQPLNIDLIGEKGHPFQKYSSEFLQDKNFPEKFYELETIKQIRGFYATILWIYPYKYNPVQKNMIYYPELTLTLNFRGSITRISENLKSVSYEIMLRKLALNSDVFLSQIQYENSKTRDEGCELLIISDEIFSSALENLANWKQNRGISTKIYYLSEIGNNVNSIKNFIENAYQNWNPAPEYILFFGDSEIIPTWYVNTHPYTDGNQGRTASDLYYVDLNSPPDFIADIFAGRISVENPTEAQNIVERIISYEENPPSESNYYQKAILAAAFQDGSTDYPPDDFADRRFAKTAEDVRNFLYEKNYDPLRIYTTYNGFNNDTIYPTYWNNQDWAVFENDFPGEELPEFLQKPQFPWNGNADDVINALNSGSFFLLHRDHGGRFGWGEPDFGINEIYELTNADLQPVVWSINCNTGWYDNETDDTICNTSDNSECFIECWQRFFAGGSCGFIASTRVSYSGLNDRLVWGWMDALWPDFTTYTNDPYGYENRITEMGAVLNYGKLYLMSKYSDDETRRTALEEFHWFGDPTMRMWTQQPVELTVDYDENILIGTTELVVNCPVEEAVATLLVNDEIIASNQIQSGNTILSFDQLIENENIVLTVNAYNYLHFSQEINLIQPSGAFLTANITINDQNGNNNGEAEYSENINFDLTLENVGNESANAINVLLSTESEYVNIISDSTYLENIDADNEIDLNNIFNVEFSDDVPDQQEIVFRISVNAAEGNWNYIKEIFVNSPNFSVTGFQINDLAGNNNQILDPGETIDLQIFSINNGHANSPQGSALLLSTDPNIIIHNEIVTFNEIPIGEMITTTFILTANENLQEGDFVSFIFQLIAGNYNVQENFDIIIGIVIEDFETGDFSAFPWEFMGTLPWSVSSTNPHEGSFCAQTGNIGVWNFTGLIVGFESGRDGIFSFQKKVSTEENYDYLKFYIDDELQTQWSGESGWTYESYFISAGQHVMKWVYEKDGAVNDGDDCAWIDYVIFPSFTTLISPEMLVEPSEFNLEIDQDQSLSETLLISNTGGGILPYSIFIASEGTISKDISESYIECTTDNFIPGNAAPLLFHLYNNGSDENIKKVVFEFPDEIFVQATTSFVGGSAGHLLPHYVSGSGVTMTWQSELENGAVLPGESATTIVSVIFDAANVEDLTIHYQIFGNETGNTPHFMEGDILLEKTGESFTWISLSATSGTVNASETEEIDINFNSNNLSAGEYNCELVIHNFHENFFIIPIIIFVNSTNADNLNIMNSTELIGNYPNPFNPETTISFELSVKDTKNAKIEIFNIKGQRIRELKSKNLKLKTNEVVWDGTDDSGNSVGSGIYFYRLISGDFQKTKKCLLLK